MTRRDDGWWLIEIEAEAGDEYAYALDGGEPMPDPRSMQQASGVHSFSKVVDHSTYGWRATGFQPQPFARAIIYELHIGTFTPEGTFLSTIDRLDHLADLGVTHVEFMPVAQFPGSRGWGYDGVSLFAPHASYGTPDDLKALVDACHKRGLAALLDVVYNHLGPDGNYLGAYGPYFTDEYHTPWGQAVNLDQPYSHEVRRFFIDNALMWLRDYRFDGLRLDAVHALLDRSAIQLLEELQLEVEALSAAEGREMALIAESDLNDPKFVRPRQLGGYGMAGVWSDDFHHAVHAVLTGEKSGYYRDFNSIEDLAKALERVYILDGTFSEYRQRNHGRPIEGAGLERFIVATQTHDQVGNRATGERLSHLAGHDRAMIAAALLLLSAATPMLFMGEEWAASSPFLYFTDHQDSELAKAVSEGRKREFAAFGWKPEEVPDPQAPDTFSRSKLNWVEGTTPPHQLILDWYRSLIQLRRSNSSLAPSEQRPEVTIDATSRLLVLRRGSIVALFNFGNEAAVLPGFDAGGLRLLLASKQPEAINDQIQLAALSAVIYT